MFYIHIYIHPYIYIYHFLLIILIICFFPECQKFLKANTSALVQNVKRIDPILDDLNLHKESTANVRAKTTDQDKMRKLLDCVNCESIAEKLVDALFKHEEDLMIEITRGAYAR